MDIIKAAFSLGGSRPHPQNAKGSPFQYRDSSNDMVLGLASMAQAHTGACGRGHLRLRRKQIPSMPSRGRPDGRINSTEKRTVKKEVNAIFFFSLSLSSPLDRYNKKTNKVGYIVCSCSGEWVSLFEKFSPLMCINNYPRRSLDNSVRDLWAGNQSGTMGEGQSNLHPKSL